ncbi:MFS transporter [Phenylobacterium sp.]|uniref:spinster family MFS transporter n=1 Tax=Phenylobacterium sp. TaxID=1871053 RepID=UPI00301C4495
MSKPPRPATDGEARWALLVLFVVALFNYVDRSLLSILQVPIKAELGLSDAQLGALTGLSFALFYASAALPLARLVDRWRRTWIMAAALAVWSGMTALSGFATGFITLMLFRIGVALGEAASVPATHSLLSDYFRPNWRGTAFAVWAFASPIGIMLGVFSGGWLTEELGWRNSFAVIGLAGLLLVAPLILLREPLRGQSDEGGTPAAVEPPPLREAIARLWGSVAFRLLVAGTTLQGFAYVSLLNWSPSFYARVHELPLSEVAVWAALIIGVGGGGGALLGGAIVDRLARQDRRWYGWAPATTCLLAAPFGLIQFLTPSTDVSIAVGFVAAFLAGAYVAPVNATAQSLVPPSMRGFTSAVLLLIPTIFGAGLGPFLTGVASDVFATYLGLGASSLRYALALILLASVAAAAFLFRMGGHLGRGPSGATV